MLDTITKSCVYCGQDIKLNSTCDYENEEYSCVDCQIIAANTEAGTFDTEIDYIQSGKSNQVVLVHVVAADDCRAIAQDSTGQYYFMLDNDVWRRVDFAFARKVISDINANVVALLS